MPLNEMVQLQDSTETWNRQIISMLCRLTNSYVMQQGRLGYARERKRKRERERERE